ncbi:hypothetical protein KAI19_05085 [bacterium]|nr:hypothetical protein [bacterium]
MNNYIEITIAIIIAALGWIIVHRFTSRRDRKNKIREIRIQYLIEAFRKIGMAAQREKPDACFSELESSFHDVQLFGSEKQINTLMEFLDEYREKKTANVDMLLNELRDDLRKELSLSLIKWKIKFFRIKK